MLSLIYSNLHIVDYAPLILTVAIFIFTGIGWYFGHYRLKKNGDSSVAIRDSLVAAIFGLSALVLGFTFSGAASRYTARMDGVRIQSQALEDVYISLKYLAPSDQMVLKESLNELLDSRLSVYAKITSLADMEMGLKKITAGTRKIQEQVAEASLNAPAENKVLIAELLIPQTRNLSSVFATGIVNTQSHPPVLLMRFLFSLLCIGAFLIGYTMAVKKESDWLLSTLYTILIGLSFYVILSLEFPNILMPFQEINKEFLLLKEAIGQSS
jgi:hypothetical protein